MIRIRPDDLDDRSTSERDERMDDFRNISAALPGGDRSAKLCDQSHELNIEYYCLTCYRGVCANCKVLFHEYCNIKLLVTDESRSLCESIRDDTVQKIDDFKAEVGQLRDDVEPKLLSLTGNREEVLSKITEYYAATREAMNEKLTQQEQDLKMKLRAMIDGRVERVSEVIAWCNGMTDTLATRERSLMDIDIKKHELSDRGISCLGTMLEAGDQIQRFKNRISYMTVGEDIFRKVNFSVDQTTEERLMNSTLGNVLEINTGHVEPSAPDLEEAHVSVGLDEHSASVFRGVPFSVAPEPSAPFYGGAAMQATRDPDLPTYEEAVSAYSSQTAVPGVSDFSERNADYADDSSNRPSTYVRQHHYARAIPETRPRFLDATCERTFNVGQKLQGNTVAIVAMVWVGHRILAVDRWNGVLKLFNSAGHVLGIHKLDGCELWDVTEVLHNGASMSHHCYVTSPKVKKIVHVDITDHACDYRPNEISVKNILSTRKGYISIARLEASTQLVCGTASPFAKPSVDILNYRGELFRSITSDRSGTELFSYPRSLDTTNNDIIVCDWNKKEVLIMTPDGNVTARYKGGNRDYALRSPIGTSLCAWRAFMVSDCKKNAIYVVSLEGKLLGVVRCSYIEEPREITCNFENDAYIKFAVVMKDRVKIFSLGLDSVWNPSALLEHTI